MAVVQFEGKDYMLTPEDSVLSALLRGSVALPNSCRAGLCQTCIVQVSDGSVPPAAQSGLTDNQKALGYFLSCQCKPVSDLSVRRVDAAALTHSAEVISRDWLSAGILRIGLKVGFAFRAGQYVTLKNTAQTGRCYSIASTAQEGVLECHIKVYPEGRFSQWLAQTLSLGDVLSVQGPMGTCFYHAVDEISRARPLLLVGMGTGLAPLLGIARTALASGHVGPISLVACSRRAEDAYGATLLQELTAAGENVSVYRLAQEPSQDSDIVQANVYAFVKEHWPVLSGYKVYLCGAESFVKKMKKQCFLSGASMPDILADSFVVSG